MKCPACGLDSTVLETRVVQDMIRRRRHCLNTICDQKFTTLEIVVPTQVNHRDAKIVILPAHTARELYQALTTLRDKLGDGQEFRSFTELIDGD